MSVMSLPRLVWLVGCVLRVCFVTLTNLYCIPTYLLWTWGLLLPLRLLNHPTYWCLEGIMYRSLLSVVATWSWNSGYHIVELGDDVSLLTKDRCLFIVNHQSTADVPFLMLAFQEKPTVLESVMWIMDRMFRYTNFGAVSVTHGDYFITQGKNARDYQMKKLRDHLINAYLGRNRRWIILFPEGGFLSKRLETSVKYATKNNFPVLEHCTLPRIGAMEVILKTLRPDGNFANVLDEEVPLLEGTAEEREPLKYVIDVTVAYPEVARPIDLLAICASTRPPSTTYMHYRCYPVDKVPIDNTDSLRDWTYARWAEKEEMLKEYYQTGRFPSQPKSQREHPESQKEHPESQKEQHLEGQREQHLEGQREHPGGQREHTEGQRKQHLESQREQHLEGQREHLEGQREHPEGQREQFTENQKEHPSSSLMGNCGNSDKKNRSHKVLMSTGKILFLHAFFVSSTLFHYYLLSRAWSFARY